MVSKEELGHKGKGIRDGVTGTWERDGGRDGRKGWENWEDERKGW